MGTNLVNAENDLINKNEKDFDDLIQMYEEVYRLRKLMQNHIKADLESK